MRAIVLEAPYQLALHEREKPIPAAGEVLVQSRANGICGSDLHFFHGTHPYRNYPMYPGHEGTGRVAALGKGVTAVQVGDAVIVEPLIYCGHCYPCRQGRTNCCSNMKTVGVNVPGALSEFFCVPAYCLHKIPQAMPATLAALVEPFSIGFQAVARAQVTRDDFVAVIGSGPIGLATLAAAKQQGAKVAMLDLLASRLALAHTFGADVVINSKEQNPADALREWTAGDMPGVVIEAVGGPRTIELSIQLVADAGRVVIVGVTEQAAQIRGVDLTRKELNLLGSRNNLHQFQNAIEYVNAHAPVVENMVTQVYALDRTIEAFELAHSHPEQVSKIIIQVAD